MACLGAVGVAGASGVTGAGRCADGGVAAACPYVDADNDGVCDNCGASCEGTGSCGGATCDGAGACGSCGGACDGTGSCGGAACSGTTACDGGATCGVCGDASCDGTHERLHLRTQDGVCDGARANGRCHGGR